MHFTFAFSASAFMLLYNLSEVSASVLVVKDMMVERRDVRYCTLDDILGPLSQYVPFQADVTSFCSRLIYITDSTIYIETATPMITIFPTTVVTATTTTTQTSYSSTSTVLQTAVDYVVRKRSAEPALMTAAADLLAPIYLKARQDSSDSDDPFNATAIELGLSSACTCLYIDPKTDYLTRTLDLTLTRTEGVVGRDIYTITSIVPGDVTTTTVTVHTSSNILPTHSTQTTTTSTTIIITSMIMSPSSPKTLTSSITTLSSSSERFSTATTSDNNSMATASDHSSTATTSEHSSTATTSEHSSIATTSEHSSTATTPDHSSTMTTSDHSSTVTASDHSSMVTASDQSSTSTASEDSTSSGSSTKSTSSRTSNSSSTSSSTVVPSGCPGVNNGVLAAEHPCQYYQIECGESFGPDDFYDLETYYSTWVECRAICDAANDGMETPCVGVVYNAAASYGHDNCRALKSKTEPIEDASSLSLILKNYSTPQCQGNGTNFTNSATSSSKISSSSSIYHTVNHTTTRTSNITSTPYSAPTSNNTSTMPHNTTHITSPPHSAPTSNNTSTMPHNTTHITSPPHSAPTSNNTSTMHHNTTHITSHNVSHTSPYTSLPTSNTTHHLHNTFTSHNTSAWHTASSSTKSSWIDPTSTDPTSAGPTSTDSTGDWVKNSGHYQGWRDRFRGGW